MKVSELLQQMEKTFNQACGIELYAEVKVDNRKTLKRVNIADESEQEDNTSTDLMEGFIEVILSSLEKSAEQDILKLSAADERKDAIYYYDLEKLPSEMEALKTVCNNEEDIELFNFKEDELNQIVGFVIAIGNAKSKAVLYKQQYPISLLKRDRYMLTPIPHKNRLKKYDMDILRMDFNYQFMLWKDTVYITDIDRMEKICSFHDIVINEAKKSIEKIKDIDILDNVEVLNDELDNITFARKLTRIYKDSKVLGKVENSVIIDFTQKHAYFKKNPIKLTQDKDKFILDTKRAKDAFVKLMNDDLLTSQLTNSDYESLAKNAS